MVKATEISEIYPNTRRISNYPGGRNTYLINYMYIESILRVFTNSV